jgi:hypothetical protein
VPRGVAGGGNNIVTLAWAEHSAVCEQPHCLSRSERTRHCIVPGCIRFGPFFVARRRGETSRKRGCKCQHPRPIHLVNTISPPRPTTRPPLIIIVQRRISTVTGVTISPKSIQPPLTTIARWPTSIPAKRTSSRKNSCGLHYWIRRRFARRGVWLRQIEQQNLGLGFGLDDERGLVLGGCAVTLPHLGAVEGDDTACRLQP